MPFTIQPLSFWLGFVLASLFWIAVIQVIRVWPRWKAVFKQRAKEIREQNLSGLENNLKQEIYQRAQRSHLASALFPLDDVIIAPRLLAPPLVLEPHGPQPPDDLIPQLVPYLPDLPELPSELGYPTISLLEALQNKVNLVILGRPGTGKSVALAHLASLLTRRAADSDLPNQIPLLFHAAEIFSGETDSPEPFSALQKALNRRLLVLYQGQSARYLKDLLTEGRALILLDGVDELPPAQVKLAGAFCKTLITEYPMAQVIVTANPDDLDGFLALRFYPLALKTWPVETIEEFIQRWKSAWEEQILPRLDDPSASVDMRLLTGWLKAPLPHQSPLEWTVRVWGLFSGDLSGPSSINALQAFIERSTQNKVGREVLATLAAHFIEQEQAALPFGDLEKLTSRTLTPEGQMEAGSPSKPQRGGQAVSVSSSVLNFLLESGLLIEYSDHRISFRHPLLCSYLAAQAEPDAPIKLSNLPTWAFNTTFLHYRAANPQAQNEWIDELIALDSPPFHSAFLQMGRWLVDAPTDAAWRGPLLRRILQLVQSESTPALIRARLITLFALSEDNSIALLFKQLLSSTSPVLRWLVALGSGLLRDPRLTSELVNLLADEDLMVRQSSCLALLNIDSPLAAESIRAILAEGDDHLRLALTEALAGKGQAGHDILAEAIQSEDMMVRRVALAGLAHVREPWVIELLEKLAIEDAQWLVRTAATHAIETFRQPNPYPPVPLPPPTEAGWLIQYASRQGVGVSREQNPLELIMQVLLNGGPEEKLAAMQYLRLSNHRDIAGQLYDALYSDQGVLSSAAAYALWMMKAQGVRLPDPQEFGFV